eukprot:2156121-Pyramimonas_sp.AAC.1
MAWGGGARNKIGNAARYVAPRLRGLSTSGAIGRAGARSNIHLPMMKFSDCTATFLPEPTIHLGS